MPKQKMPVVNYFMNIHYGVCCGPVDELLGIYIDDKTAWEGSLNDNGILAINQPELFGGKKKEGGAIGFAHFLNGAATQIVQAALKSRTPEGGLSCPDYRDICSVWFTGFRADTFQAALGFFGFYWRSNSPYVPGTWIKVKRLPKTGVSSLDRYRDIGGNANPALIIWECLTNADWGMGANPVGFIDQASFEAAAKVFFDEKFGLAMIWTRQTSIEAFIREVLDHVSATLYVDLTTGLMTLQPIRALTDAQRALVPLLTPDTTTVTNYQRKLWGETTNEIVLTWTNPTNEEEETLTVQDQGSLTQNGEIISDSRNYYGIRDKALAQQIAVRDLRVAATPLASFELSILPSAFADLTKTRVVPGGCVRLTYPELGITDLLLRVGPIEYAKPGSGQGAKIKIEATEDVFTADFGSYYVAPGSEAQNQGSIPANLAYLRKIFSLPAYFLSKHADRLGLSASSLLADATQTLVGFLGTQSNNDTLEYDMHSSEILPNGSTGYVYQGSRQIVGRATLTKDLPAAASSTQVTFSNFMGQIPPAVNYYVFIGAPALADESHEIAVITASAAAGFTLNRGILDTTPKTWPAGTEVFIVNESADVIDPNLRKVGTNQNYKLAPRTSLGVLPIADATVQTIRPTTRHMLPYRPANVTVAGVQFGTVENAGAGPWTVSWRNRNRLTEAYPQPWGNPNDTPETNQVTLVQIYDAANPATLLKEYTNTGGSSQQIVKADMGGKTSVIVRVRSKRDTYVSLQGHSVQMNGIDPA